MKHYAMIIALAVSAAFTAGSSAQTIHRQLTVGDFTAINLANGVNVVYEQNTAKAGKVEFDTPQELANNFIFKVDDNGKLNIQVQETAKGTVLPTLHVYSSALHEVTNNTDSTITVAHLGTTPTFKATTNMNGKIVVNDLNTSTASLSIATGKGHIYAYGKTEKLNCTLAGTGQIHALDLVADEINCKMGGSGHIYCNSNGGELKVKGLGSGKVHYKGSPSKVNVKQIGTIKALPYTEGK